MFIVILALTGAFSFATDEVIETSAVMSLCMYQLVPELFLDVFVTFLEIHCGGLGKFMNEEDVGSKHAVDRWGDLGKAEKAITTKASISVSLSAFVLVSVAV